MKIVVFYYSQSGQALQAAQSLCSPLEQEGTVIYKAIQTLHRFPFPWSKNEFFDIFPETRLGIVVTPIEPIDLSDVQDADLVLVFGQSWFLSPSMPMQSFFADASIRAYLQGRPVVFVNACRNMWLMTLRRIREYASAIGFRLEGHIVLQDENPNLTSVITIIRWLIYGHKEATSLLPAAGISAEHIQTSSRFGQLIGQAVHQQCYDGLQAQLLEAGAIHYKPSIMMIEQVGHRMFGFWAKFIRRRGEFGDPRRVTRLNIFYGYLLAVLFLISPFAQLFFYLTYPLHHVERARREACGV